MLRRRESDTHVLTRRNSRMRRSRPPDYFARGMQLRLMGLVFLLMLVAVAIFRARDPAIWRWLAISSGQQEERDPHVETRLPPTRRSLDSDVLGSVVIGAGVSGKANAGDGRTRTVDDRSGGGSAESEPTEQALQDIWSRVTDSWSVDDRAAFQKALYSARRGSRLDADHHALLATLVAQADAGWSAYLARARAGLDEADSRSPGNEMDAWRGRLDELERSWHERWKVALESLVTEPATTAEQLAALDEIQQQFDHLAIAQIRDNALVRPVEREILYRFFERLAHTDDATLRDQSLGAVGYLALFQQPDEYRGKVVTVRGTLVAGYRVRQSSVFPDAVDYYSLVLRPQGGPNSPILIYALELPAGFPAIGEPRVEGDLTKLDHAVQCTGIFFKRAAYVAGDSSGVTGLRTAPLLLSKSLDWQPPPPARLTNPATAARVRMLAFGVLALAAPAGGILYWTLWRRRRRRALPARIDGKSS